MLYIFTRYRKVNT